MPYFRSRAWRRMTSLQNITGIVDRLIHFVIGFKRRCVFSQGDISDIISATFMTSTLISYGERQF